MERRLPDMSARLGELLQGLKTGKRPRREGDDPLRRLPASSQGGSPSLGPSPSPGDRPREIRAPNVFLRGLRGSRRPQEHHEGQAQTSAQVLGLHQEGHAQTSGQGSGPGQVSRELGADREGAGSSGGSGSCTQASAPSDREIPAHAGAPLGLAQSSGHSHVSSTAVSVDPRGGPTASAIGNASGSQNGVRPMQAGSEVIRPDPDGHAAAVLRHTVAPSLDSSALPLRPSSDGLSGHQVGHRSEQAGAARAAGVAPFPLASTALRTRTWKALDSAALPLGTGAPEGLNSAELPVRAGARERNTAEAPAESVAVQLRSLLAERLELGADGRGAAGAQAAAPGQATHAQSSIPPGPSLPGKGLPGHSHPGEAGEGGGIGDRHQGHRGHVGQEGHRGHHGQEGAEFSDALRVPLGASYGPRRKVLRIEGEPGRLDSRSSEGASPRGRGRDMPTEVHSDAHRDMLRDNHRDMHRDTDRPEQGEVIRPPAVLHISPHNVAAFLPTARALSGADMLTCLDALYKAIANHKTVRGLL